MATALDMETGETPSAETRTAETGKTAVLYRMVMKGHLCPYGLKSKWLLQREGYEVDDRPLRSRAETDAFMAEHGVETTPQAFIDGRRVGGYDALRERFGSVVSDAGLAPVLRLFAVSALLALAASWAGFGTIFTLRAVEWMIAFSMAALALQKLRDVDGFTTGFLNYDLLAQRYVPYAYVYPFAEAGAAVAMVAGGVLGVIAAPVALFIGTVGAISVIKAVYIDRRSLKCACMGGDSSVPLGAVSLAENLAMAGMGIWMLVK